jgi:hypothetical protein
MNEVERDHTRDGRSRVYREVGEKEVCLYSLWKHVD